MFNADVTIIGHNYLVHIRNNVTFFLIFFIFAFFLLVTWILCVFNISAAMNYPQSFPRV